MYRGWLGVVGDAVSEVDARTPSRASSCNRPPVRLGWLDREVDQSEGGVVVGEVSAGLDALADLHVQALDRVGIPYERRWMPAVTLDRLDAGGVRAGEYGATVRDGGIREQTQVGQAVLVRWASSPC